MSFGLNMMTWSQRRRSIFLLLLFVQNHVFSKPYVIRNILWNTVLFVLWKFVLCLVILMWHVNFAVVYIVMFWFHCTRFH